MVSSLDTTKDIENVMLSIDGQEVRVNKRFTILEAARQLNIEIPTLCYHKALSPYGACRLCVVEIKKDGWKKIQTSCIYPVEEGLKVKTDTPEVQHIRRTMVELMLAKVPHAKSVRQLAEKLGIKSTPFVTHDEDCILCGLCVRMCSERMGRNVVGFKRRGDKREIVPPFDLQSADCMVCGACFNVCPTASERLKKMGLKPAQELLDEFDEGLRSRPVIRIPFPQAVPNAAIVDRDRCVHLLTDKCKICQEFCEAEAINFDQQEEKIQLNVGSIIYSSGVNVFRGKYLREYGHSRYANIVTSIEFERILSASGPYQGHVLRPGDRKEPKNIAFIQCVGSRDDDHDYCSSVCCMYAIKQALIAMEHSPGLACTIFAMDLRAFGKGFDEYYEKAKKNGVRFIRCRPSMIDEDYNSGNLIIDYTDTDSSMHSAGFDMVVLSCGLHPPRDIEKSAQRLGIRLNKFGFCKVNNSDTVRSSRKGIFLCGSCVEPKDIPETVTQASAAASKAMEILADVRHTLVTEKAYPPEKDVAGQDPKIGVFICHCGINIGSYVNVPEVVEYARGLPNVAYVENNMYTCSQDSQKKIVEVIQKHSLNRVVVASCTPRTHEMLFRETIREAGLNPYLFEMANIRDQCSWIHMTRPADATTKAKDLIKMAVAKARLLCPLRRVEIPVTPRALVIGGGVAGIVASLSLARQGFEVFLVEREKRLGGHLRHIYYTVEGDDIQEYLKTLVEEVKMQPKIHLFTRAEIESVDGFIGNYETSVRCDGGEKRKLMHGVIIVATGGQEYQPNEFSYGTDKRIVTQNELEKRLVKSTSADAADLRSVVMVQCIGSRNNGRLYCSRRCCSQAVKNALKLHDINPKTRVYILYRDIRTYGFKEEFYTRAREAGVMFIRYEDQKQLKISSQNGNLSISAFEPILQEKVEIPADLLVLSTGIEPNGDNEKLAKMLKVPLNNDGFFLEAHVKLRPVDFATEGVFIAGLAHSPKFINETISQAEAAAARAATILAHEKYFAEAAVSHVDENLCVGCGVCSNVCPYKAIEIVEEKEKRQSSVNEALCKGCGTCVAACPSGAMDQFGFTKEQIMAMIGAMKER